MIRGGICNGQHVVVADMGGGLIKVLFEDGTHIIGRDPSVVKAFNPDEARDATGKWTAGWHRQFSERQLALRDEIADLNSHGHEFMIDPQTWDMHFPNVTPSEFITGITGLKDKDIAESGDARFKVREKAGEGYVIQNLGSFKLEGAQVNTFERAVDPDKRYVHHELLEMYQGTQGTGAVKAMFRSALPLYEKMGIKTLDLYANLDAGGYAWARYGFRAVTTLGKNDGEYAISKSLAATDKLVNEQARRLTPDALSEYVDYKLAAKSCRGPECMTQFTSLKTPTLDAELRDDLHFVKPQLANPSLTQYGMNDVSWHGRISLDPKDGQRERLDRYVGIT